MHGLDLIVTLTGGLVAALVGGYLTQRLKLSPIVGYILAGLVVGPYTPGFVADRHVAEQLAEVGVILLMFGVGLQLHIEDLLAVKRVAIPGAIFQSLVATAIGAFVVERAGWGLSAGIVYGVALSVASTVVLVRVLSDNRQLHTPTGHIAVGWLVVEDLFTVLVLVLMPAIFAESGGRTVPVAIGLALVKVVALGGLTIVVGGRVLPWVLTAGGAHPVARAVHAGRPRHRPRHRRVVGAGLRRVDGARRLPGRPGRRPIRVRRACHLRRAADARRLRRAVLRLGRHAARSRHAGATIRRCWRRRWPSS